MAVRELTTSRNISYNEGQPTGIREFHCHPYATEQEVIGLIGFVGGIPGKMARWPSASGTAFPVDESFLVVFDHAIRRDPNVTQAWIVTVTYRQRSIGASIIAAERITPDQPGAITMRQDFTAAYEDAWRQWLTPNAILSNASLLDDNKVPRYPQFSAESDIGGIKIDAAGYPTSILRHKVRLILDVVDTRDPTFPIDLIGTRNSKFFVGYPGGTVVFIGCGSVELPNGMHNLSYTFEVDWFYHLRQIPKRQANGYVVLDLPANTDDQTATGQAKVVSYFQPYPLVADHYQISQRFSRLI
jgi:hypothetical protein